MRNLPSLNSTSSSFLTSRLAKCQYLYKIQIIAQGSDEKLSIPSLTSSQSCRELECLPPSTYTCKSLI
ncbi:hypothetical protein CY34DRAFT_801678 [Suillus luteus UH-Slu-Lm8-n1]|uniref:Uncharacterized protein n=1 Tax=Suillus luteus UH-Slu-Lm8-n1 TaxID=930992 RepID=A0A0D0BGT1_9AGAM|nr:hypothetical protein CY34DRAFT_801678 [Suillus luteus UH-Slu-Lm8-n1]